VNARSAAAVRLTPFKKFLRNPKIRNGSSFSNLSNSSISRMIEEEAALAGTESSLINNYSA
jgi:hypothetical protein